jgi:hypothetical protein
MPRTGGKSRIAPDEDSPEWAHLVEQFQAPGTDLGQLARENGYKHQGSLYNVMSRAGILRTMPLSIKPRYDNAPRLYGDLLILADLQMPFHDAEFIMRCLDVAHAWGIRQGVSAGDLMNGTAFSKFGHKPADANWKEEARITRDGLMLMHEAVEEWLLLMGNHDIHIIKHLNEQIGMEDIIKLLDRPKGIRGTDYYYCLANDTWRISHPRNVSVIPARIPSMLCSKYNMNVAAGHGHLVGIVPWNQWLAVDIGICCDPLRLDYNAQRDNTRPAMQQGALILKAGSDGVVRPHLLSPWWTDWPAEKRKYRREV